MSQQSCRRGGGFFLFSALFCSLITLSSEFLLPGAPSLALWGRVATLCLRGGGRPAPRRKVKDLQESCKKKGLRVRGSRAELLERLGLPADPVSQPGSRKRNSGQDGALTEQQYLEEEVAKLRRNLSLAEAKLGAGSLGASLEAGREWPEELFTKGPGEEEEQVQAKQGKRRRSRRKGSGEEEEQKPPKVEKRRRSRRAGPTRELEEQLWGEGLEEVAGVDEVCSSTQAASAWEMSFSCLARNARDRFLEASVGRGF